MEYYSAIKRKEIELFVVRWVDLETVIQSEVSQKEKNKYCMLIHIYGILKKKKKYSLNGGIYGVCLLSPNCSYKKSFNERAQDKKLHQLIKHTATDSNCIMEDTKILYEAK